MANKLKLISFQRQNSNQILNLKPSPHSELVISFIVYSPNKKLSFIETIIRKKQKIRNDIGFSKCKDLLGLSHNLETTPAGIPLFCISDDQLNEQIISKFINNRQVSEKQQIFSIALFLDDLSSIPKQYYTLYGINIITTHKQELIAHIQKAFEIRKGLIAQSSMSSLNSEENKQIQQRFDDSKSKQFTPEMVNDEGDKKEPIFVQERPGFAYNINYPQKNMSVSFSKETRQLNLLKNGKGQGVGFYYNIEPRQSGSSFRMSSSRRFQYNDQRRPGPGSYEIR